jgi:hypothetical protein
MKRKDGFWTFEKMQEEAAKYKTKREFQLFCNAGYIASVRSGAIKEFTHFEPQLSYWNEDSILDAARKCSTRTEFCRKYRGAHSAARRLGIVGSVNELLPKKKAFDDGLPCYLYTYIHPEFYAYVGITNNPEYRHSKHIGSIKNEEVSWLVDQVPMELYSRYSVFDEGFYPYAMPRPLAERAERLAIRHLIRCGYRVVNKMHNPQFDFAARTYSWE